MPSPISPLAAAPDREPVSPEGLEVLAANDFLATPKGKKFIEDAAAAQEAERKRRMRPIQDAAALDSADPDYAEKLQVLVEEVKENLAAADAQLEAIRRKVNPTIDEKWRAKRLARIEEKSVEDAERAASERAQIAKVVEEGGV